MYVRCAVCGEWLDVKPGGINRISHGLCSKCFESEMERVRRRAKGSAPTDNGPPPGPR